MDICLSFTELSAYIGQKHDVRLDFTKVSDSELSISKYPIGLTLGVAEVGPTSVVATYRGGMGMDLVVALALKYLRGKLAWIDGAISREDGHRLHIDLSQIPQAATMLEALTLRAIAVESHGIRISADLK